MSTPKTFHGVGDTGDPACEQRVQRLPASLRLVEVAPGEMAVVKILVAPVLIGIRFGRQVKLMPGTKGAPVVAVVQAFTCVKLPPKFQRWAPLRVRQIDVALFQRSVAPRLASDAVGAFDKSGVAGGCAEDWRVASPLREVSGRDAIVVEDHRTAIEAEANLAGQPGSKRGTQSRYRLESDSALVAYAPSWRC